MAEGAELVVSFVRGEGGAVVRERRLVEQVGWSRSSLSGSYLDSHEGEGQESARFGREEVLQMLTAELEVVASSDQDLVDLGYC